MWLIGQEWKYSNVWSGLILIGRGLDLKQMVLGKLGKKASVQSSLFSFEGAERCEPQQEKKSAREDTVCTISSDGRATDS